MKDLIERSIRDSIKVKESVLEGQVAHIEKAAHMIIAALRGGGKLISFGNGGSAADSQHIVAELVGRFKKERKPLPALAFTTNTSIISAIANDYSYDVTFSRQMEALGKRGDIVLAISTSGNSPNVLAAVKKAKEMGIKTIGLTGGMGGKLALEADLAIVVSSKDTPRVQESHAMIGHILCDMIEQELCK